MDIRFRRGQRRAVAILGLSILLVLGFQNCESTVARRQVRVESSPRQEDGGGAGGNGSGYDGKIYVQLLVSGACADGSIINARIEFRSASAYLTRENCSELHASNQIRVNVDASAVNPSFIVFEGRLFTDRIAQINGVASSVDNRRSVAGTSYEIGNTGYLQNARGFFARLEEDLQPIWAKTWTPHLKYVQVGASPDGATVILANDYMNHRASLVKYDRQGRTVWTRALLTASPIFGGNNLSNITVGPAGEILLTGEAYTYEDESKVTTVKKTAVVLKLDANGSHLWARALDGEPFGTPFNDARVSSIAANGDICMTGSVLTDTPGYILESRWYMARLSTDGTVLQTKFFPESVKSLSMQCGASGEAVAILEMKSGDTVYARLTKTGELETVKSLRPLPGTTLSLETALLLEDRSVVLAAKSSRGATTSGIVVRLNSRDQLDWAVELSIGAQAWIDQLSVAGSSLWIVVTTPVVRQPWMTDFVIATHSSAEKVACSICKPFTVAAGISDSPLELSEGPRFVATGGLAVSAALEPETQPVGPDWFFLTK